MDAAQFCTENTGYLSNYQNISKNIFFLPFCINTRLHFNKKNRPLTAKEADFN